MSLAKNKKAQISPITWIPRLYSLVIPLKGRKDQKSNFTDWAWHILMRSECVQIWKTPCSDVAKEENQSSAKKTDQMLFPKKKKKRPGALVEIETQGHGEVLKCCSLLWEHVCLLTRE